MSEDAPVPGRGWYVLAGVIAFATVVAIGGITPENGATLIEAGADMLAVIEGVFAQSDIHAAAHRYAQLFQCM